MNLVSSSEVMERWIDEIALIALIIIFVAVMIFLTLAVLRMPEREPPSVEKNKNMKEFELDLIIPLKLKKSSIFIRGCWTILNCFTIALSFSLLLFFDYNLVFENLYVFGGMLSLGFLIGLGNMAKVNELFYLKKILNKYDIELGHGHFDLLESNIIIDPKDIELMVIWLLKNENSPFINSKKMKEAHLIYYILLLKLNTVNKT
ncbi:hypothetical protein HB942_13350 [Listeria welshimeri]|nr:hypothetical protein [Listeria welshimeri]